MPEPTTFALGLFSVLSLGFFGWRRSGDEWSVVGPVNENLWGDFDRSAEIVDRRAITLDRWFEARVGSRAERIESPDSSGVATDA